MSFTHGNIFAAIPGNDSEEVFETLTQKGTTRVERIISTGQSSPADFWYDQQHDEFVILLKGKAVIRFESDPELHTLTAGDYYHIPAHTRHRVESTDLAEETVWLAFHF